MFDRMIEYITHKAVSILVRLQIIGLKCKYCGEKFFAKTPEQLCWKMIVHSCDEKNEVLGKCETSE